MGNRKLQNLAKTVLAVVLAIMVILPSTKLKAFEGKLTGGSVIGGNPVVIGTLGDDDDTFLLE